MGLWVLKLSVGILIFGSASAWAQQTVTLSTFYPAPNGNYDALTANNISIGTVTPTAMLTISSAGTTIGGTTLNILADLKSANANGKGIWFGYDSASATSVIGNTNPGGITTDLAFYTNNGGTWGERMRLTSAGNLSIGTNDTNYKLNIGGDMGANGYYYVSDERLKKDIVPLVGALEKVKQINGVSFTWKSNDKHDIGVIAQNVETVLPELVHTDDQGMKAVEYGNLTAVLIEAVKDQQKQIDALKMEIEQLKMQVKH